MTATPADTFDLIVIGSGPAGEKAAVKAAYFGKKVALVEKESQVGGAGVNTGTLPSKTLKETSIFFSGVYEKGLYRTEKVLKGETRIDDFLYRQRLVQTEVEAEVRGNIGSHGVALFQGFGSFEDPHHLRVQSKDGSSRLLRGEHFVIATGSYPFHPENIPFDRDIVHDSDSILQISRIPKNILIVGAGVIGCEYATIFATMGTRVFLVNNSAKVLPFLDAEIAQALVEQMRKDGVTIHFDSNLNKVERLEPSGEDSLPAIRTELSTGVVLETEMFLYAAGRNGGTNQLGLEKAGVALGKRQAILVDEHYRTNVPHIFAVGDVIGFPALAATGMDQGRVAISHMYDVHDLDRLPKLFPYGIYTIPEVSMVGLTEEQAKEQNLNYGVGVAHHALTHRGRIMGLNSGFLKIIFLKDGLTILGCHLIGPLSAEIIHFGQTLVNDKKTIPDVIGTVFNYPTLHDLYKYACYDGLGNLSGKKMRQF
jgi:NAD(P) transhydrogenase